ncbi:MAG: DedA family protein [Alphaproteobacteria bacterium]|nr:DedA family protein [Alphaproteobacteria bacterium]
MIKNIYNKTIKRLYDWAMGVSAKENALWILVAVSFVESSFFPIPPDIILIPLVLAQRQKAFKIALYCTISSVLGGYFGYFIGAVLFDTVAQPIIDFYHYSAEFQKFQEGYNHYGAWLVFMAGLTPFPYKIITITSGVTDLNLWVFSIASILARGGRFFLIAGLLYKYGEPMKAFIEKNLGWLSILFVVLLIGSFYLIKFL